MIEHFDIVGLMAKAKAPAEAADVDGKTVEEAAAALEKAGLLRRGYLAEGSRENNLKAYEEYVWWDTWRYGIAEEFGVDVKLVNLIIRLISDVEKAKRGEPVNPYRTFS